MRSELEAAKKLMEISLIEKQELTTRKWLGGLNRFTNTCISIFSGLKEQLDQIKSSSFKTSDTLNVKT